MVISGCFRKAPIYGSQNCNIGPSFYFMSKNGKIFIIFT